MIRKSAKNVSPRKGHALSRPPSGGLTCSEPQVEDILSAGESTEEERIYPQNSPIKGLDIPVRR